MGIYIKKVLGFGVDITAEEAPNALNQEAIRKLYSLPTTNYVEFLKEKYNVPKNEDVSDADMAYYLSDLCPIGSWQDDVSRAYELITVIDRSASGGEPEGEPTDIISLVITPPLTVKEWKHNDDSIDYYEEVLKYQDTEFKMERTMRFINQGLFPYEGTYVNHKTGDTFQSNLVNRVHTYLRLVQSGQVEEDKKAVKLLLAALKVSSMEEFNAVIHPAPPISVIDIAEWTGIFKDPTISSRLRPCLLQYWS